MPRFAICDDDMEYADSLKNLILNKYMKENDFFEDVTCIVYLSANAIIERYETDQIDIVFMDIELGNTLGFDVARQLQLIDDQLAIVFMTSHEHYVTDAFVCRPLGFIRKHQLNMDMQVVMFQVLEFLQKKYQKITVKIGADHMDVLLCNIHAIEVYDHKLLLLFKDNSIEIRDSLSRLENELQQSNFVKTNRGRLVNLKYIKQIEGKNVYLYNGYDFVISEDRVKGVTNQWLRYQMMH